MLGALEVRLSGVIWTKALCLYGQGTDWGQAVGFANSSCEEIQEGWGRQVDTAMQT